MTKAVSLSLLLLGAAIFRSHAADLDAPTVADPVTIRSEIKRGHKSVYHLLDQTAEILSFIKACDALRVRNEEQRRSSVAFRLGVETAEAIIMRSVFEKSKDATTRKLAEARANIHFTMASAYQKELGITEMQMQELFGGDYKRRSVEKKPSAEIRAAEKSPPP